jgi:hypothetical protein
MTTYDPSQHPRGDGGRFRTKTHTEPEGGLGTELASAPKTFRDGWVEWRTPDGKRHRLDGPAVVVGGTEAWWQNGERHRDDGPAVTRPDGHQEWWQYGELHREDEPAYIGSDGVMEWHRHGKLHRENGPAVIEPDGTLEWWEHGKRKPPEIEAALTMVWKARTPKQA